MNLHKLTLLSLFSAAAMAQSVAQLHRDLDLSVDLPASTSQSKSILEEGNSKVDPALRRLLMDSQSKSIGEMSFTAKGLQVPLENDRLAVVLAADSEANVGALRDRVQDAGGEVVAIVDEAILARIPPGAVDKLGGERHLEYMAPQGTFSLPPGSEGSQPGPALSRGVLMTKANLLHQKGIRGQGVKVGILDFGFTGYRALQTSGALPAPKAVKAFGKDGGWDRINKGTPHGTACAEIVHAMAPDAEIFVAAIGDGEGGAASDEIIQAAMWLASQGVHIISFSGGGHFGPHNGTDLLDKLVEQIVAKGILWVNAAGNEGDSHWATTTRLNEQNLVMTGDKPYMLLRAKVPAMIVMVSWDDWGPNSLAPSANQDFDIFLAAVDPNSGEAKVVAASQNPQNGRGAPRETIGVRCPQGQLFALYIRGSRVSRPVRLHVYTMAPADMAPKTPVGSIGIPATSPLSLSVGAINIKDGALEAFSSQGPTDDNRSKPNVSAPDRVMSAAYKAEFPGTSAACPHVSGFAALVRQMRGRITPADLSRVIESATSPIAANAGAGRGIIDASKLSGGGGGGAVPGGSTKLAALFDRGSEENELGVKVVVGRPSYRIGDGLKIGFRAERDCSCVLMHRSSRGEYTPLEPSGDGDLRLEAGKKYAYPLDTGMTIRVTGPPGKDEIALICSRDSLRPQGIETTGDNLSVSVAAYDVTQ